MENDFKPLQSYISQSDQIYDFADNTQILYYKLSYDLQSKQYCNRKIFQYNG